MNTISFERHFEYIKTFTSLYMASPQSPSYLREAAILPLQYPFKFDDIQEGELFVGKLRSLILEFTPQTNVMNGTGFAWVFDEKACNQLLEEPECTKEQKAEILEILDFWKTENTATKFRNLYSKEMQEALPSDAWTEDSGAAFPLYRMSGSHLDYDLLLQLGVVGLKDKIQRKQNQNQDDSYKSGLYQAMQGALDVIISALKYYSSMLHYYQGQTKNSAWNDHLKNLEKSLNNLQFHKPCNLLEAMQLMYIYNAVSGSLSYGRIDEYLGDFLANDLKNKTINEEGAITYIQGLWKLMENRSSVFDGRLLIGGKGRRNPENADRFAILAMEASLRNRAVLPQVNLRIYKQMNPLVKKKAWDLISQGCTFPLLNNDDVNIPAVSKAFEIDLDEAASYTPYGCGEYVLYHKSFGTPSGVINLLKVLEITMNNGIDSCTGMKAGLALGDCNSFHTFDDLLSAYKKQIEYFVDQLALQEDLEYQFAGQEGAFLFFSILFDDCIEKGEAIFSGGIRYLGGTLEAYGNTNTADSLLAIKKAVFEDKILNLNQLHEALLSNFAGHEKLRIQLTNYPKYGNDHEQADAMHLDIHNHICNYTRDQRFKTRLHNYMIVLINNHANTILGRKTIASADGRKAYTYMANANNPSGGFDKNGITAMMNSLVKSDIEIHAGAVQNFKFSSETFIQHRAKVVALFDAYFENGGAQAMISVVSKNDLENAILHPENYSNVMVRVGGFSARFIDLEKDVQLEVLSRTLN